MRVPSPRAWDTPCMWNFPHKGQVRGMADCPSYCQNTLYVRGHGKLGHKAPVGMSSYTAVLYLF